MERLSRGQRQQHCHETGLHKRIYESTAAHLFNSQQSQDVILYFQSQAVKSPCNLSKTGCNTDPLKKGLD